MRILDRERYWAFIKAYLICFSSLLGLYIVIDAFSNLDEFAEVADSTPQLFYNMGRFYLIRMSLFYDQICGIITMMAAIFTVTWMQRNNELLAMLAAGVSTHRVIRPVLISGIVVSSLAVVNQEFIMPPLADELQKPPDDDGVRKVIVTDQQDLNDILLQGKLANRNAKTIFNFAATVPVKVAGKLMEISAREARYIPLQATNKPHQGGWLLRDVTFQTPAPPLDDLDEMTRGILCRVKSVEDYPPAIDDFAGRANASVLFLKSEVTFTTMTRSRHWYQFAQTPDLIRALSNPINLGDRANIEIFLHTRLIRPLLGFNLMLLSLPLVLGGAGRNMFVNLGMSLGTSGIFYSLNFVSQYLAANEVYGAQIAAWLPLIIFGTIAVGRWDTIRT